MLFNSFVFLYFFALLYPLYLSLQHRAQNICLLIASYLFYSWWDARFVALLVVTTLVDYACGMAIEKTVAAKNRLYYLWASVAINLSVLGFFKYFGFFVDS